MFNASTRGLRPGDFLLPFAITYSLPEQLPRRTPSKSRHGNRTFLASTHRSRRPRDRFRETPPASVSCSRRTCTYHERRCDAALHCRTNKSVAISSSLPRGCKLIIRAFAFSCPSDACVHCVSRYKYHALRGHLWFDLWKSRLFFVRVLVVHIAENICDKGYAGVRKNNGVTDVKYILHVF